MLDLRLQVCRLEIEADKQVKLRQLELDISKHIALVPQFREAEICSKALKYESIVSVLRWLKEVWPLMLQCKLMGKAQEVCSTLSLKESVQYKNGQQSSVFMNSYPKSIDCDSEITRKAVIKHLWNLHARKAYYLISGVLHVK